MNSRCCLILRTCKKCRSRHIAIGHKYSLLESWF
jgi:hypothetical protein